jgi:hypothetical protein
VIDAGLLTSAPAPHREQVRVDARAGDDEQGKVEHAPRLGHGAGPYSAQQDFEPYATQAMRTSV